MEFREGAAETAGVMAAGRAVAELWGNDGDCGRGKEGSWFADG